LVVAFKYRCTR